MIMNEIETDAAELHKTASDYDLAAGKRLAAMTSEEYKTRLESLCKAGDEEMRIHNRAISKLPPYIVAALREGNTRVLNDFRNRRGSECVHIEVESWFYFQGGREAVRSQGL